KAGERNPYQSCEGALSNLFVRRLISGPSAPTRSIPFLGPDQQRGSPLSENARRRSIREKWRRKAAARAEQAAEGRLLAEQLGINPDHPDSFAGTRRKQPRRSRSLTKRHSIRVLSLPADTTDLRWPPAL